MKKRIAELESANRGVINDDDSDILGGLPTSKKEKIINEVEELYAKNMKLEQQNA